jgi:NadR type nicotinamide-nucleotide adenylyltransferase
MKKVKIQNIVIIGAESTGKTALAQYLSEVFRVRVLPEYVRFYFDFKKETGKPILTKKDVPYIATGQHIAEEIYFAEKIPLHILDTNLLLTKIYAEFYYGKCPKWLQKVLLNKPYQHYLLLKNDLGWAQDEQRDSPEVQKKIQNIILQTLISEKIPFSAIEGSGEARLKMAENIIRELIK